MKSLFSGTVFLAAFALIGCSASEYHRLDAAGGYAETFYAPNEAVIRMYGNSDPKRVEDLAAYRAAEYTLQVGFFALKLLSYSNEFQADPGAAFAPREVWDFWFLPDRPPKFVTRAHIQMFRQNETPPDAVDARLVLRKLGPKLKLPSTFTPVP